MAATSWASTPVTRAPRGPWASQPHERVDRGRRTASLELDASIGEIPYPAVDAETSRLVRGAGAKTDTLDAAPHDGTDLLQG